MANKQEQVLIIDPYNELKFRGPFTQPVTSYIKLSNPTTTPVVFKIKTTAPKRYCVRPNAGVVEPKSLIPIAVSLQPFEFDPNEKNKHKFMVQTMIVQDSRVNLETLWKDVDSENLMDSKLKCVFEMPMDGDTSNTASQPSADKVDSVNDEARRIGEIQSGSPDSTELAKAAKEVKYLREEESSLRMDNLKLKEEIEYLRRKLQTAHTGGSGGGGGQQKTSAATALTSSQSFMLLFLGTAVGMALIGIWLGKYML